VTTGFGRNMLSP